jgi:hypothetical protein
MPRDMTDRDLIAIIMPDDGLQLEWETAHPFAFLATYSTRLNQESDAKHVPLKFALQEFAGNQAKLLELLATVHCAGKSFDYRRAPVVFSTRLTIFIPDANHNMLLLKANKYR